jgi:hypothetical protein
VSDRDIVLKKEFINECYSSSAKLIKSQIKSNLDALNQYENHPKNRTPFFNFSNEELKNTLIKLLYQRTDNSFEVCIGRYEKYIDWAESKGYRTTNSLDYKKVFKDIKKEFREAYLDNAVDNFVSRDKVYNLIDTVKDSKRRNLITYLAIFEGVYGIGGKDFLYLKKEDIHDSKVLLSSGYKSVPREVVEQFKLSKDKKMVYKILEYSKGNSVIRTPNGIFRIMDINSKKNLDKKLTASELGQSGMFFYLRCIEIEKGKLAIKDFLKVAVRYSRGTESNSSVWRMQAHYLAYKTFCEKENIKFVIDDEIRLILAEINNLKFEYPRDSRFNEQEETTENNLQEEEVTEIEEVENLISKFTNETEKLSIIKSRVGQGLFRKKLFTRSCKCEICGFDYKKLLIASHCKPWSKSLDHEKLDINNGLLLCPNHDSLFDKALITFSNEGNIILSDNLTESQFKMININQSNKIIITPGQIPFIKWHREEFFKKG